MARDCPPRAINVSSCLAGCRRPLGREVSFSTTTKSPWATDAPGCEGNALAAPSLLTVDSQTETASSFASDKPTTHDASYSQTMDQNDTAVGGNGVCAVMKHSFSGVSSVPTRLALMYPVAVPLLTTIRLRSYLGKESGVCFHAFEFVQGETQNATSTVHTNARQRCRLCILHCQGS